MRWQMVRSMPRRRFILAPSRRLGGDALGLPPGLISAGSIIVPAYRSRIFGRRWKWVAALEVGAGRTMLMLDGEPVAKVALNPSPDDLPLPLAPEAEIERAAEAIYI
jgi:hypothetical protein